MKYCLLTARSLHRRRCSFIHNDDTLSSPHYGGSEEIIISWIDVNGNPTSDGRDDHDRSIISPRALSASRQCG